MGIQARSLSLSAGNGRGLLPDQCREIVATMHLAKERHVVSTGVADEGPTPVEVMSRHGPRPQ